jgi:hypothetical protein
VQPKAMRDENVMKESPQLLIFRGNLVPLNCHEQQGVGICLMVEEFPKQRNHP